MYMQGFSANGPREGAAQSIYERKNTPALNSERKNTPALNHACQTTRPSRARSSPSTPALNCIHSVHHNSLSLRKQYHAAPSASQNSFQPPLKPSFYPSPPNGGVENLTAPYAERTRGPSARWGPKWCPQLMPPRHMTLYSSFATVRGLPLHLTKSQLQPCLRPKHCTPN